MWHGLKVQPLFECLGECRLPLEGFNLGAYREDDSIALNFCGDSRSLSPLLSRGQTVIPLHRRADHENVKRFNAAKARKAALQPIYRREKVTP